MNADTSQLNTIFALLVALTIILGILLLLAGACFGLLIALTTGQRSSVSKDDAPSPDRTTTAIVSSRTGQAQLDKIEDGLKEGTGLALGSLGMAVILFGGTLVAINYLRAGVVVVVGAVCVVSGIRLLPNKTNAKAKKLLFVMVVPVVVLLALSYILPLEPTNQLNPQGPRAPELAPTVPGFNWAEILVTVGLTVAGAIAIAYSTLYIQDKMARRQLFKSFLAEVRHNIQVISGQAEAIESLQGMYAPFGLKELHISSYYALKEKGFLADVPQPLQERILRCFGIVEAIRSGRFDQDFTKSVRSLSDTPHGTPIGDLAKEFPTLESDLASFLRIRHKSSKPSETLASGQG